MFGTWTYNVSETQSYIAVLSINMVLAIGCLFLLFLQIWTQDPHITSFYGYKNDRLLNMLPMENLIKSL